MNYFADRRISVLQIVEDGSKGSLEFVYEAGQGRPDLYVEITAFSRLSIRMKRSESLDFELAALASPGRAVRMGGRDLHLQFLRADNPLTRGPLLLFENGEPLPCFVPRHPLLRWRRAARRNVLLPVLDEPDREPRRAGQQPRAGSRRHRRSSRLRQRLRKRRLGHRRDPLELPAPTG